LSTMWTHARRAQQISPWISPWIGMPVLARWAHRFRAGGDGDADGLVGPALPRGPPRAGAAWRAITAENCLHTQGRRYAPCAMCDVRCAMCDVRCAMCDVRCAMCVGQGLALAATVNHPETRNALAPVLLAAPRQV